MIKAISLFSIPPELLNGRGPRIFSIDKKEQLYSLARSCECLFTLYEKLRGEDQKEFGKALLEAMTLFLQTQNLINGLDEAEGIAVHPYLVCLRKAIFENTEPAIPPLPLEVYYAFH